MRLAVAFGFIASVFASYLFAHGYDSLVRHDLGVAADLSPTAIAATNDGGLWMVAVGNNGEHQLVRLDANGNREAGLHLPSTADDSGQNYFKLYPLNDGSVLELDRNPNRSDFYCVLRRISRSGALVFARQLELHTCKLKFATQGVAPFLVYDQDDAEVLADDGALITRYKSEDIAFIDTEFSRDGQSVLFLATDGTPSGHTLVAKNFLGEQLWASPLQSSNFIQSFASEKVAMQVLADGKILFVAITNYGFEQRIFNSAGVLLDSRETVFAGTLKILEFGAWAQDGAANLALSVRFEEDGIRSYGALLFSANAAQVKRVRYQPEDTCPRYCAMLGRSEGFAVVLTGEQRGKLLIVSARTGVATIERDIGSDYSPVISNGQGGTMLLPTAAYTGKLRAFNASGVEITPPAMTFRGYTQPHVVAATIAEDATHYVISHGIEGLAAERRFVRRIRAISPSSASIWQRELEAKELVSAQVVADARRVCVYQKFADFVFGNTSPSSPSLVCFDSQTGAELSNVTMPPRTYSRTRILDDGRLRMITQRSNSTLEIMDISDANVASIATIIAMSNVTSIADIGPAGSILLTVNAQATSAIEWVLINPAGDIVFRRRILAAQNTRGSIAANGNLVLVGNADALYVSNSGQIIWNVVLPSSPGNDFLASTGIDADQLYLLRRNTQLSFGEPDQNFSTRVQAVALRDGHLNWSKDLKSNWRSTVKLSVSPISSEIFVTTTDYLATRLHRLNRSSGTVLEQRTLDCTSAVCYLLAETIDRRGVLHSLFEADDVGRSTLIIGRADTHTIAPEVRIDQAGLSGAWYSPQIAGQGLFVEYFPQNNLLFAPWFTYAFYPSDWDTVANLRWYTLSGIVEPGAKVAQLEIRRNIAGAFNSAPITESTLVGSATLRAQDCNRATLEFQFIPSEAQGIYGVLPLDRLTGGSAPCQLSGGQTLPGRDARPARGGFDGRQSGSWYQPQTAGQGLMMTVQPATASAPGFFFGGWFTYDAGAPNDPTSQHWLTLSGEIPVNAQAGVLPVTIYRTLGGQLASVPTQNNAILGQATLTFSGCASAVLRYQFDDTLIAGTFKVRAGVINLERLGACPAQ